MTKDKITVKYADIVAYGDNYIITTGNKRVNYDQIQAVTQAPHSQSKLCRMYMNRHLIPVYERFGNEGEI